MPCHEALGKILAPFQLRPLLLRPDNRNMSEISPAEEIIMDTYNQGLLGSDYNHVNRMFDHKVHNAVEIGHTECDVLAVLARAGISRCDVQLLDFGALGQFPSERTFPAARANDEDIHLAKIFFLPIFSISRSYQNELKSEEHTS